MSDDVSLPYIVTVQPTLTFFKPVAAPAPEKFPGLLSTEEAAEHLTVVPETVRRLCRKGAITYTAVTATDYRFAREDLEEYLRSRTVKRKSIR